MESYGISSRKGIGLVAFPTGPTKPDSGNDPFPALECWNPFVCRKIDALHVLRVENSNIRVLILRIGYWVSLCKNCKKEPPK